MGRLMRKKGRRLTPKRITGAQRRARKVNIEKARRARSNPKSAASAKRTRGEFFRGVKKMKKAGLTRKDISHLINTKGVRSIRKLGRS